MFNFKGMKIMGRFDSRFRWDDYFIDFYFLNCSPSQEAFSKKLPMVLHIYYLCCILYSKESWS